MTAQAALPHAGFNPRAAFDARFVELCVASNVSVPVLAIRGSYEAPRHGGRPGKRSAWVDVDGLAFFVAVQGGEGAGVRMADAAFAKWMRR